MFLLLSLSLSFCAANKTEGKKICKNFVQRGLGLASEGIQTSSHVPDKVPLVVCITRLVAQKGLHLITHAIKHVEELVSYLSPPPLLLANHWMVSDIQELNAKWLNRKLWWEETRIGN